MCERDRGREGPTRAGCDFSPPLVPTTLELPPPSSPPSDSRAPPPSQPSYRGAGGEGARGPKAARARARHARGARAAAAAARGARGAKERLTRGAEKPARLSPKRGSGVGGREGEVPARARRPPLCVRAGSPGGPGAGGGARGAAERVRAAPERRRRLAGCFGGVSVGAELELRRRDPLASSGGETTSGNSSPFLAVGCWSPAFPTVDRRSERGKPNSETHCNPVSCGAGGRGGGASCPAPRLIRVGRAPGAGGASLAGAASPSADASEWRAWPPAKARKAWVVGACWGLGLRCVISVEASYMSLSGRGKVEGLETPG